ncbi:MAG TPA: prepilin-type N-terminal cleavage/methylation domain-containing protein [Kofleriaceae bacterium]|nr:prepilin-type N-terminal cleavage/methylation domain-containing protein [Kofleriaceae bacterium]
MREPSSERGFTIIELMIVVAIIAVLAVIVVPLFTSESKRGKAKSEVQPMFAELASREESYKGENSTYLTTAACPPSASTTGTDSFAACLTTGSDWTNLRVQPPEKTLSCSYTITAGASTVDPIALLPSWVTGVTALSLATSWYFIEAVCPYNKYFTASWDAKIRSEDGK